MDIMDAMDPMDKVEEVDFVVVLATASFVAEVVFETEMVRTNPNGISLHSHRANEIVNVSDRMPHEIILDTFEHAHGGVGLAERH